MIIPKDSNFSKEIAKQFKQIFHRDMTLGGLQDLQEELNMINPVDTYLANQVSQKRKEDEKKHLSSTRTIGQRKTERESSVRKTVQDEAQKKRVSF